MRIFILSLGCSKNLVDSETIAGFLEHEGWMLVDKPEDAEIIIVNTCGFIQSAKEESIREILEMAAYKESHACRLLVAAGCMAEKYRQELAESIPEIDAFLPASQLTQIVKLIKEKYSLSQDGDFKQSPPNYYLLRRLATPAYTAYLKVSEGCDNNCTYCLIPMIRGPLVSRPFEDIIEEAALLAEKGVREIIILAQDTTAYGLDLYHQLKLPDLLDKLAELPFVWIRLLYAYPEYITEELLAVMRKHKNICNYLDMPIQHIDDEILKAMNRRGSSKLIREKISLIKRFLPDAALRTTFIVGFPGEDKKAFQALIDFAEEGHFLWVGAFPYGREMETPAALLPSQKDKQTKERRYDRLMKLLAKKSEANLQQYMGSELMVLVEGAMKDREGWYYGRSQYQAPDVDGVIYFSSETPLLPGDFIRVLINKSEIYDLIGEVEQIEQT